MRSTISYSYRVIFLTVALFLFWDCSGRLKPWNLRDIHALDVQLLNTNTWSKSVSENMADLDIIMKKELRYYLDNDLRIYENSTLPRYELSTRYNPQQEICTVARHEGDLSTE